MWNVRRLLSTLMTCEAAVTTRRPEQRLLLVSCSSRLWRLQYYVIIKTGYHRMVAS